jgi:two-component system sensor kinase FixL
MVFAVAQDRPEPPVRQRYQNRGNMAETPPLTAGSVPLEMLPAIVAVTDRDGMVVGASRLWLDFVPASLPGRRLGYLTDSAAISGAGPADASRIADGVRTVITRESERFELEFASARTGETRWFRLLATPRTAGHMGGAVVVHIDVTDAHRVRTGHQEREALLSSILETVPDAMVVIDSRGIVQSFSSAAEQLFGWRADEAVGKNVRLLMPSPYADAHDSYLARYQATGERRIIGIGRVVVGLRKDGSTFPMELSVGEVQRSGGSLFTGFVRDLTERQATEGRLQELQAELLHVSRLRSMGEMAAALAHELNQPLTATAMYLRGAQLLLDRPDAPELARIREAIRLAVQQTQRSGDIIRRLREFVARGEVRQAPESMIKLIEESSALALVGAKERGIKVMMNFGPALPPALVDRVQVQQVLLNLLRNAIEAMESSPVRELNVGVTADDDMIRVSVIDTGSGIDEAVAQLLFQPFVTTKVNGMGIGLSVCRAIIEGHKGRLWMEPNPAGGSIFHFTVKAAN